MSQENSLLKYLLAGGFGGICTVVSGHPLDTIKVRLQTMPGEYKNTLDATRKIVQKEGFAGLYKGMTAPLITIVPIFAISFLSFGVGKKIIERPNQVKLTNYQLFEAGMFSGFCTALLTAPSERIKCLLQMQTSDSKKYTGLMDCAFKLWKDGGLRNLFVGTCATLLRDIPATGMYFYTYEVFMQTLETSYKNEPAKMELWQPLIAGGCAGMTSWAISMPADVMKSRLQTAPMNVYPHGMRSIFPIIVREEGISALYRSIIPVMFRAFPVNAACFVGLEAAMRFLDIYFPGL